MTRDFAKQQLARIQAFWPSLPATTQAVDEFQRALRGFNDDEIERGISDLVDTHLEPGAPKLGHIIAKVRVQRPKTYETATEEERELYFAGERRTREARDDDEIRRLEEWLAQSPEAQKRYETLMTELLAEWPEERLDWGRRALHASVLQKTRTETPNLRIA